MSLEIQIEFEEAYELLISLYAYAHLKEQRALDIGTLWGPQVEAQVGDDFTADLYKLEYAKPAWVLEVLAWRCPVERDASGFLQWLGGLSLGDMYELLTPFGSERLPSLPSDLRDVRDKSLQLLYRWNEAYFKALDPLILSGLAADAEQKKALAATVSAYEVIEAATGGIVLEPAPSRHLVVLVPQYHYRPWNINSNLHGVKLIFYPADPMPIAPGEPPTALLRLTRALADESRLRILHYLAAGGRHTFTDLLRHTGLARSTVHQHMVLLRASGLVRVHEAPDGSNSYSLRTDALDSLGDRLRSFLASGHMAHSVRRDQGSGIGD
jgi:DNA-binding transcriptional ArsR family regulator